MLSDVLQQRTSLPSGLPVRPMISSTPTRSTPPLPSPPPQSSSGAVGSVNVIQLLQRELAELQAEVEMKKRSTLSGVPSIPAPSTSLSSSSALPYVPPLTLPNSYSETDIFLRTIGSAGASTRQTPQNSSGQLMFSVPPQRGVSPAPAGNESIVMLQQQLRELQLLAMEKAGSASLGGSERGQTRRPASVVPAASLRYEGGSERGERRKTDNELV
jgi:hypothetical protein